VQVPRAYVKDGQIILNISPTAVADLRLENGAMAFHARFGGAPMQVYVPMVAVLGIYARENGQGMLLAEDGLAAAPPVQSPDAAPAKPSAPSLQAVPAPAQDASVSDDRETGATSADGKPDKPRPKGKPSLHVVK
jgi:stringent starvation protein B